MPTFFVLQASTDDRWMRAALVRAPGTTFDGRYERQFVRGVAPPPEGTVCVATSGAEAPDLLANARRLPILSVRVAAALRDAGCTGFLTYPVALEGPGGARHVYEGLVIYGKAELLRERSKASIELHTGLRVTAPIAVDALHVDPASWDGADVFSLPEWPLLPIVSEKAVEALGGIHPRGLSLAPAETFKPL
jgi:hypothetical protein